MAAGHGTALVNRWLASLGGPEAGLALNEEGRCFLVADDAVGIVVSCPDDSQLVVLIAQLANVPIPLSPVQYEALLALNLQLEATGGAQIFFDKRMRTLGLLVAREVDMLDQQRFASLLERFKDKALECHPLVSDLLWRGDALPPTPHPSTGHPWQQAQYSGQHATTTTPGSREARQ